jgi:putative MATE family efflux protein
VKQDHIAMMANGKISSALMRLCIPAVLTMTVNGIYNVTDAFFIGLTGNMSAIGAVSILFPLFIIVTALGIGVSVGAGSYISRCLGAKRITSASETAGASLIISFIVSIFVTTAGYIWLNPMLFLMGAREEIMPAAIQYTNLILSGTVFVLMNSALAGIIRAEGNSLYTTFAVLTGTVVNILLDPLFIFVFNMGIQGAAIATLISYLITFFLCLHYYTAKKSAVPIIIKLHCIRKENAIQIVKIGIPAMLKQLLLAMVFCIVNSMAVNYGESAVTAAGICEKINSFFAMTLLGIAQGFMPLAAFNYGAGNYKRLFEALKKILIAAVIFASVGTALYILFAHQILSVFCNDFDVIQYGTLFMYAFAAGLIPVAFEFQIDTLFFASGMAKASFFLTVSRQGLIFIPFVILLNMLFGLSGIAWSQTTADVICSIAIVGPLLRCYIKNVNTDFKVMMLKNQTSIQK